MSIEQEGDSRVPVETSRVSKYWEQQFEKNRADASLWTNNEIVMRHIYRLISGGWEEHWLPWFFNHYLDNETVFERSLSICCGDGAHELVIANTGRVRFIRAFDISEGAIAQANAAFEKAAIPRDRYAFEVGDANNLEIVDQFDLILSTGALHHVTNLEGLLSKVSSMLELDGYFVVLEYVGPNRFQWTDTQVAIINRILRQLDPRYLKDNTRIEFGRPLVADMMKIDPSEAVRSEDILRLLPEYFAIEYLRDFNGTIIHQLYPLLDGRLTNTNAPDFDSIVRMILLLEDILIREKVLPSDFAFAVCRNKKLAPAPGAPHRQTSRRFVGSIDVFDGQRVAGWAADLQDPTTPVQVEIYLDDVLHATVLCDAFRQDLKDAGYGDGKKGFVLSLESPQSSPPARVTRLLVAGSNQLLAQRVRDSG